MTAAKDRASSGIRGELQRAYCMYLWDAASHRTASRRHYSMYSTVRTAPREIKPREAALNSEFYSSSREGRVHMENKIICVASGTYSTTVYPRYRSRYGGVLHRSATSTGGRFFILFSLHSAVAVCCTKYCSCTRR